MSEIEINIPTGNGFQTIEIVIEVDEFVRQLSSSEMAALLDTIGKQAVIDHFDIEESE